MRIALKSIVKSKFVSMWDSFYGQNPLLPNRDAVGVGETFELLQVMPNGELVPFGIVPIPNQGGTLPIPGAVADSRYVGVVKDTLTARGINTSGPEGAFNIVKWVVWGIAADGTNIGLLKKDGGENVVVWNGVGYSAGRICYPNGTIFKILTDVGGANGPTWDINGKVEPKYYAPPLDPAL